MSDPLVSVVILNHRRREALLRTLDSVRKQNYAAKQAIVVDNASDDDVVGLLRSNFPEVRIVAMSENLGCAGRNRGVEIADGPFVVTLDNDVYFDSPSELGRVVSAFLQRPNADCIAFKVLNAASGRVHLRDWCHPRSYWEFSDREFPTSFIPEGACAFRRDQFLRIGGYYEPLWIGCEGEDLALRMLDAGMSIVYCPEIRVRHIMADETRAPGRNYYYYTRNYLWIASRLYTGWRTVPYLTYNMGMMALFSLREGHFGKFCQGLRDGVRGTRNLKPALITCEGWKRLDKINALRPGLFLRLKKHFKRPLV